MHTVIYKETLVPILRRYLFSLYGCHSRYLDKHPIGEDIDSKISESLLPSLRSLSFLDLG
jgi:hypothetical protein